MDKRIFILFALALVLVPMVSADSLGILKKDTTIELFQSCDTCTYVNLSSVNLPNGTINIYNTAMTKSGTSYTSDFSNTDLQGAYSYEVCGDKDGSLNCEILYFEINYNGEGTSTSQGIIYSVLLGLLVVLFFVSLWSISILPSKDERTDEGLIVDAGNLKHLRKVIMLASYGLLMGIFYIASNIGFVVLTNAMFGKVMFTIFQVMYRMLLPVIFGVIIWIFVSMFQDRELKKMIERGGDDFGDI